MRLAIHSDITNYCGSHITNYCGSITKTPSKNMCWQRIQPESRRVLKWRFPSVRPKSPGQLFSRLRIWYSTFRRRIWYLLLRVCCLFSYKYAYRSLCTIDNPISFISLSDWSQQHEPTIGRKIWYGCVESLNIMCFPCLGSLLRHQQPFPLTNFIRDRRLERKVKYWKWYTR